MIINEFIDLIKQKYNIIFLVLIIYIIRVELEYGYHFLFFGLFFKDNPITSILLDMMRLSDLKFLEIWLEFNLGYFISFIFYYSVIEPPKDLREFLIIKKNFFIYPYIFIYVLFFLLVSKIILNIQVGSSSVQSQINTLLIFLSIETIVQIFVLTWIMRKIDKKWNLTTPREYNIWKENHFTKKQNFINALSYGFENQDEWIKSFELKLKYPFEMKHYNEMVKGGFPTMDDYFNALHHNISNFDEWKKSANYKRVGETKKQFKERKNLFDIKKYIKFTLNSKYNLIFLLILAMSVVDYFLFINSFYIGKNYVSKLTFDYYVNRWVIFFSLTIITYLSYFYFYKKPNTVLETNFIKINTIVYPVLLLVITSLRPEVFTSGKPQYYMDLTTRILQNVMQPFIATGGAIFVLFLPLIVYSFYSFQVLPENRYLEYLEGNFITYNSYKKAKLINVHSNPDYSYVLSLQDYLN